MIYQNFEAFVRELAPKRPIIGLDLGTKTIGVAISDVERTIATPHYTIRRKDQKKDFGRIWQIATERDVCGVVIGMPTNMDGSEGPRTQSTRAFARALEMYMPRPVTFWDERLSTVSAERALIEADTSRAKRELLVDKVAAAVILQGALDRIAFLHGGLRQSEVGPPAPPPVAETPPPPAEEAPPARHRAGRARAGRALPRADQGPAAPDAEPKAQPPAQESNEGDAPKRDAAAIRRRRMMTRRLGSDD